MPPAPLVPYRKVCRPTRQQGIHCHRSNVSWNSSLESRLSENEEGQLNIGLLGWWNQTETMHKWMIWDVGILIWVQVNRCSWPEKRDLDLS